MLGFFKPVAEAMLVVIGWLLRVSPLAIFALAFAAAREIGLDAARALLSFAIMTSIVMLIAILGLSCPAGMLGGVGIVRFFQAAWPGQLLALATRSSLATVPTLVEGARSRLGLSERVVGFGIPFAASTFKPNRLVSSPGKLLFLAWVYGVAIDPLGYAFFVGYVILLAATTVGVPNQHARHVTLPAYLALGIPVEGVILIAAVDMLWDFAATALNATGYLAATTLLPRRGIAAFPETSPEPVALVKLLSAGAALTVTGSCHRIEARGRRILVDCGLFQGPREIARLNREPFPFDPSEIDAVLLTHGHLDHCGRLPLLAEQGFEGPIFAIRSTRLITEVILQDAAKLQQEDYDRAMRKAGKKPREIGDIETPLYVPGDIPKTLRLFREVAFDSPIDLGEGIRPCSARPATSWEARSSRSKRRTAGVVASGDLGNRESSIQKNAEHPRECDAVIVETTYADRTHRSSPGHVGGIPQRHPEGSREQRRRHDPELRARACPDRALSPQPHDAREHDPTGRRLT